MKKLFLLSAFALSAHLISAQQPVKKYVLIEHFTNSVCPVCASKNPAFYTLINQPQYASEIHHIAVHPMVPYPSCVFYKENKVDNTARADVYNIFGTPNVALNGKLLAPSTPMLSAPTLSSYLNQTSPVYVKVTETGSGSTKTAKVEVRTVAPIPAGVYKVYAMLAEKKIDLKTPNNETTHHDVLRDIISKTDGEEYLPAALGASVEYTFNYTPSPNWKESELYVLAFVQNTLTKEVLNSGTRFDPVVLATREALPQSLSIQPNPAQDFAYAQIQDDVVKQVEVFSASGQRMLLSFQEQQGQIELPVAALTPGVYFVKIKGEKGVYVGKMVRK